MILLALALLLAGAWIGARGMRGLGRSARGLVTGPWRPGAAVLGGLIGFAGLALLARGEWAPGAVMIAAGALAAVGARKRRPAAPAAVRPGRREAAALLGVAEDASPAEVEAAHRRLIRTVHPDAGGTAGLAAQLNAARETLLRRR